MYLLTVLVPLIGLSHYMYLWDHFSLYFLWPEYIVKSNLPLGSFLIPMSFVYFSLHHCPMAKPFCYSRDLFSHDPAQFIHHV